MSIPWKKWSTGQSACHDATLVFEIEQINGLTCACLLHESSKSMDKLMALQVFSTVAECGSFTAAAERLDLSRAMATRHVEALEQWLGARLLHRTTRRVTLTDAGEQCLRQGQQMLALADDLCREVQPGDGQLRGLLRVTCSMSFGHAQMAPALARFMGLHPHLKIDLLVDDGALDLVQQRIDLAIRISADPGAALIGRPLAVCESVLVASPAYLDAAGRPTEPQQLQAHRCLGHMRVGRNVWQLVRREDEADEQQVAVTTWFNANEATVLAAAAVEGAGIAMQPTYLVQPLLASGALEPVLSDWRPQPLTVYALYSSRRHLPAAVRSLLDFLVREFQGAHW
jgi:DNA-binding transcriptional LysR family regulator